MKKRIILALAVGASFGAIAADECDPAQTNEIWTVNRFEREFFGRDSWEPFNRSMFGVFDFCAKYAVDPFCYLYSSIVPKPLIKGIDNCVENLEEPVHMFSNLFMGEWQASWDATRRFVVNSTLGVGGLFDPAKDWFYIYDSDASLSDTLTCWGVPPGPRLALPFMPRATVRGHVGYVADFAFDLKTWINFCIPTDVFVGYTWALIPNKAPVWRGRFETLFAHADDGYAVYMPIVSAMNDFNLRQFAWRYYEREYDYSFALVQARELPEGSAERREMEAKAEALFDDARPPVHASAQRPAGLQGEWREIPGYAPRGPSLDSLRALCFSPVGDNDFWWERRSIWNGDFSKSIEERDIVIAEDLPKATYSFVAPSTEHRAPGTKLVIILPGIGSGRTASEAVAMAETLHAHGYAAVICDSVFHWEHVRSVNRGILPGNLHEDMKRYADYLAQVLADLEGAGLVTNPDVSVMGWSMGGLTVAHFAAQDELGFLPFKARRFVAINPPASMRSALAKFKPGMEASRSWTKEQAYRMFTELAPSLYGWADQNHPRYDPANPPLDELGFPWDYAPNVTEEQANYLLGQTIRVMFPTLVAARHRIKPFPWLKSELTWFHRNDFYDEVGDLTMDEYMAKYVPACYDGVSADEMLAMADIHRLAEPLQRNLRFSVIHTWNDPLEDDDDRWLFDRLFGKRITWFADGGHCGYFYTKPFEDELLRRLAE